MMTMMTIESARAYSELLWMVECKVTGGGGGSWWQPICAFNSKEVAVDYAKRCAQGAAGSGIDFSYRVRERETDVLTQGNDEWRLVWPRVTLKVAS